MNEVAVFHYEQLDATTADFLRKKESNMRDIVSQAYTNLGRELKEAQDVLAKNGYGCFQSWAESIGIKRNKVYDLIRRYETIIRISDEQTRELIATMPEEQRDLGHEIPSTGKVKKVEDMTVRELREVKAELKIRGVRWDTP